MEVQVDETGVYLVLCFGTAQQLDNATENYTLALYETLGAAAAAAIPGCQRLLENGAVADYTGFSMCCVRELNSGDNIELWARTETSNDTDGLFDIDLLVVRIR